MKKLVFALQVSGLVAAVPLYVMVELNRPVASVQQAESTGLSEQTAGWISKLQADTTVALAIPLQVFKSN